MFAKLLVLFILLPLAEIYLLIQVGSYLGAFHTVVLVVLTAAVGASLARLEGLRTLGRIQSQLAHGQMPAEEWVDALLIFMAGALLLAPGFITDTLGLYLLIPFTRISFKRWLRRQFDLHVQQQIPRPPTGS